MRTMNAGQRRQRKEQVLKRDGAQCNLSRHPHLPQDLILKRIIHKNLGGSSRLDNLHLICHGCNTPGPPTPRKTRTP